MDPITEIQFTALANEALVLSLRAALIQNGVGCTLRDLMHWVAAGRVRVDDEVVRDPAHALGPGSRVELCAWAAPGAATVDDKTADIAALHYVDDHVLVAEYMPPRTIEDGSAALLDHLRSLLEQAGVSDRVAILCPDHEVRASGLVAAGMSPAGENELDRRHRPLGVRVNVKALVRENPHAELEGLTVSRPRPGVLLVRTPPTEGSIKVLADLRARGLEVLEADGPGPAGPRPLLMHVASMALTHPLTGRTSMYACRQGAAFTAALTDEA